MKLPIIAVLAGLAALSGLASVACASDSDVGTVLVPNSHGGYNVTQAGAHAISIPFFGTHGYAARVIAEGHNKPNFILVPGVEDVGHGSKVVVYHRVYFATPEEAEAARLKLKN